MEDEEECTDKERNVGLVKGIMSWGGGEMRGKGTRWTEGENSAKKREEESKETNRGEKEKVIFCDRFHI